MGKITTVWRVLCLVFVLFFSISLPVHAAVFPLPAGPNGEKSELNIAAYKNAANETLHYFSGYYIDSGDPNQHIDSHILFNKQNSAGTWQYGVSRVVRTDLNLSEVLATVLQSDTAIFRNPQNNIYYRRVMYLVRQPAACDGTVAGFLYVAFSNNDLTWTTPQKVLKSSNNVYFSCLASFDGDGYGSPVEAAGGFFHGNQIWLAGIEGNLSALTPISSHTQTKTYLATAPPFNPALITIHGQLSANGMVNPNADGKTLFRYFVNLNLAYDSGSGMLYITRVYPYPYDTSAPGFVSACTARCAVSSYNVAALPNRGQIYRMSVGANIANALSGTWQLLYDVGQNQGFNRLLGSSCTATALISPQSLLDGLDVDAISLLHTPLGGLHSSRQAYIAQKGRYPTSCPDDNKRVHIYGF